MDSLQLDIAIKTLTIVVQEAFDHAQDNTLCDYETYWCMKPAWDAFEPARRCYCASHLHARG